MIVLLVCAILAAAAFLWVARPILLGREALPKAGADEEPWQLNAVLQQIREIELDFHAGRLSSADYENLRKHYESRAAELLEKASK